MSFPTLTSILLVEDETHVSKMIKNQHEHELMWFKGREALIERQKKRGEGQKKLDEVL
jgi:hypothetical protein